jgi:hypothetical protein
MVIFSRTEGVDDAAFVLRRYVARLHREAGIEIKVVSTDNPPTGVGEDGVPLAGWANLRSSAPTQRSGRTLGERCAAQPPTCCRHRPSRRSPQRAIVTLTEAATHGRREGRLGDAAVERTRHLALRSGG